MTDAAGKEVPVEYVQKFDRLRDKKVRRIVTSFTKARKALETLMAGTLAEVETLITERGVGVADRGNVQISSFDGMMRVEIVTRYSIILDDRAIEARRMMRAYLGQGLEQIHDFGPRQAALALVDDAFTPSRAGSLRTAMVQRLLNLKIIAPEWRDACEVLRSAMETYRGKSYLNVSVRPSRQQDWETIRLDIADCWPAGVELGRPEPKTKAKAK